MRNCLILALVVAISFIFSGLLQAQAPSNDERLRKLEEICQQQEQQIEKLQGQLGVLQNEEAYKTYTEKIVQSYLNDSVAQEDDGITAGYENGFFIRSADGKLQLTMTGYFQTGLGIFENDSADNNSFFLHGAYTMFDIRIMEKWHAFIKVNFAAADFANQFRGDTYEVELADAFLEYNYRPEINFIVGNQLVPFSIEGQYAEIDGISIWQEPFINSWSPVLDVGFLVHGVIANRVGYRAGIFNGNGSNTLNNNDDMMMAGQLRFYLCGYDKNKESFIHVGFLRNRNGNGGNVSLYSPWGRELFDGGSATDEDAVSGWRTAVDAGAKISVDMANGSNFRAEGEFMYSTWQRETAATRLPWLEGYAFSVGAAYRHCLDKENEGSGIIVMGKFSYNDIDNKKTDDPGDILGQRAFVYTAGVGYAFNKHIAVNFNWIIMNLDEKDIYGGPKTYSNGDVSGSLEQAWFLQFTAMW